MEFLLIIIAMFATSGLTYLFTRRVNRLWVKIRNRLKISWLPRSISKPLREAKHYGRLITEVAQECPPGPMQSHLNNLTLKHVNESLDSLSQLEQALVKLYSHRNLNREMHRTCREIEKLSAELLEASDKRATLLRRLLKSKRDYVTVLEEIHEFQSQAELEIRKIASDLITTHAEMLLIITRGDFNPNRLKRFDENIQEHLTSLRDMVAVMDELGYSRAAS